MVEKGNVEMCWSQGEETKHSLDNKISYEEKTIQPTEIYNKVFFFSFVSKCI